MATESPDDSYFQDLFGRAQKTTDYTELLRRAAMHACLISDHSGLNAESLAHSANSL
jgi:hypothetical protein